ncbi:MAG: hypothetical protein KC636_24635, partial [Myxococcales bacterium]|nr:hypothetical protein [Myxococcales bacterium]
SASFHLVVVSARSSAADEQRVIYTSGVHALQQHRPYVEMSLGSSALRPGGVLRGVVALSNVTHLHYRGMAVELVAVERYPALFGVQTHHRRSHTWVIPVEAPGDGQPIHFALSLPGNIVPGFTCGRCSLEWYLVLRVDVAWAPSARMWVPVVVLGRRGAEQSEQRAPLAVGAERLDLVWRDVATRTGFLYDGGALTGQIDGVEVRVTRERRGRNGAYLVAMLRYPDLGIGLSLAGAAPCVRLLGRDQGQVSWLARALGQVVSRCPVVAADDREMRCELPDNGQRARTVLGFVEGARALASALAQAVPGIPAPACMAAMVPAWERTARALGGRLHPAPMRIEAATDEMPFELRTDWDEYGRPARTVIELRPASKIDVRYRLQWSAQDGVEGLDLRELSLSDLCVGARGLAIDEGRIRLFLPGPLVDPAAEMKRVATLVWLGHRLSGRVGVYR